MCVLALAACTDGDDASDAGSGGASADSGGGGSAAGSGSTSGAGGASGGIATSGTGGMSGVGGATGASGTGGRSGTAGSSGKGSSTSGSGGADSDAGADCSPCIGAPLRWGPDGGFVAFRDSSELADCNTYRHTREPARDPGQTMLACERGVPCMGSGLHGIADVLQALSHPDVEQALGMKMVVFGRDTRPVDGTVFRIEHVGSVIDVGSPCMEAGCNATPAGVTTLVELLRDIDAEQLNLDPCAEQFE
jgi:hypothetical protein